MRLCLTVFFIILLAISAIALPENIVKETIESQGRKRSYYLFVPDSIKAPAPMIVLLHGSGRNGSSLVEKWKDLASKEGIILVGPDAQNSQGWFAPIDGPDFLYEIVEWIKLKHRVDPRRIYLFGHSAGASFALIISLLESNYFAATAVHAGAMQKKEYSFIAQAERKIPLSIIVGTQDPFFPLSDVRATRDALNEKGFSAILTEIPNHGHNYYDLASKINSDAWDFLKKHEMAEPKYRQYDFQK